MHLPTLDDAIVKMWPDASVRGHINLCFISERYIHIQKGAVRIVQLSSHAVELDVVLDSSPSIMCGGTGDGSCSASFLLSLDTSLLEREWSGDRLLERLRLRLRLEGGGGSVSTHGSMVATNRVL